MEPTFLRSDPFDGVVTEAEMNSLANLRGIPNVINRDAHLSQITTLWKEFYTEHPTATKQELLDFAKQIDDKFGHLFDPPIRLAPGATPVGNPF